jgi:large subunit ribosomal protein L30e
MADTMAELRKLLAEKRLAIGTARVVKLVRQDRLAKVYLSANCPSAVKDDLTRYCGQNGIECHDLEVPNRELGVWCKKPFAISVIGVLKSAA